MKPSFHTPLEIEVLDDGRDYRLLAAFQYDTDVDALGTVSVPAGFVTDFASVPRGLWNVLPPLGRYGKAAVVHDYLYRTPGLARRADADHVFLEAMKALGVSRLVRTTMYLGVRSFGWASYKGGL